MFKWLSKPGSKTQIIHQQPQYRSDEFQELFIFMVKCFRQFGLCPVRIEQVRGKPRFEMSRFLVVAVVFILLSTWVALVASFFLKFKTPMITGIANHIQFITNAMALTATLAVPIFKYNDLNGIFEDFNVIDDELNYFNVKLYQSQLKCSFLKCYIVHVLFLIMSTIYDAHVMLILGRGTQLWLWFFHLLPFILYSLAFMQAFTMIKWVKIRIQHLNSLIEQYYRYPPLDRIGNNKFKVSSLVTLTLDVEKSETTETCEELAVNNRILTIVSKTIDLASRLESYNGLIFLFGYLALFSVTTIQVYFCYLFMLINKPEQGFSINTFGLSLTIIIGNLVAILALPYICEQVGNESKTLMSYLSKLSMKYGQNVQSSIWFPNLISSIKFSALGFFNINYNMLSGFFAALITYLIIFIQFNSIVPAKENEVHLVRKGGEKLGTSGDD
ncbi:uncharacterized protein LOC129743264 [Uranotaenia lowii]|uniref:uncharacterized protein LOC129743264 n=1 Tax=Uranotaenia lowii TaxID=190385 RepID=UPI002478F0A8|nr:uncharacterized protein LOC129743264 [Uranotaenia lowii]